jgi:hypothetical protein
MSTFVSNIHKICIFGKNNIFVTYAKFVFHWGEAKLRLIEEVLSKAFGSMKGKVAGGWKDLLFSKCY